MFTTLNIKIMFTPAFTQHKKIRLFIPVVKTPNNCLSPAGQSEQKISKL